jgi:haloacetate dehalogenase
MFEGFETFDVPLETEPGAAPVTVHGVRGGSGPPLLLLHGFPQTHAMWAPVASALARTHTVVAPDLRGYGSSSVPLDAPDHAQASFRAMARDQVQLMASFGYSRFGLVGHDRGARVAHRLALDSPACLDRVALLDILPTRYVFEHLDQRVATMYYHWFFLPQPAPLPETLIAADPTFYLRSLLGAWGGGGPMQSHAEALAAYELSFSDPAHRHAMIEDYRAAATIDLVHDRESADRGERVAAPALILWGARGLVGASLISPVEVWRAQMAAAVPIDGRVIDGAGHFLVEDAPEATLASLEPFLGAG